MPLAKLGRGGDFLFHHDLCDFIQNAVVTATIAQIQTDGQLLLGKIPALLRRC
jgi:hypothetical protein